MYNPQTKYDPTQQRTSLHQNTGFKTSTLLISFVTFFRTFLGVFFGGGVSFKKGVDNIHGFFLSSHHNTHKEMSNDYSP